MHSSELYLLQKNSRARCPCYVCLYGPDDDKNHMSPYFELPVSALHHQCAGSGTLGVVMIHEEQKSEGLHT